MFITGFPFQAEMYVFETEGQEMLLVDVNSLIVCKDKCSHKDSYKKKKIKNKTNISERLIACPFNPRVF